MHPVTCILSYFVPAFPTLVRYVFDREVMEVFTAMNNLMRGKDPWTGKKIVPPPPPPPSA